MTVDGAAQYVYDAFNMRVKATSSNGTVLHYAYNPGGQRVSTWDVSGNLVTAKYYANGHPIGYYSNTDGHLHYEHQDRQGTERVRTCSTSSIEGSYASFPFGDGFTSSGKDTDPFHFAGLDHDADSNTEHAEFRQYSSAQGRWLSPDPSGGSYDMGNPQSLNRYVYVLNNPLSMTDPKGLQGHGCEQAPFDSPNSCFNPLALCSGGECTGSMSPEQSAALFGQLPIVALDRTGDTESVTVNGDSDDDPPVPQTADQTNNLGGLGAQEIPLQSLETFKIPNNGTQGQKACYTQSLMVTSYNDHGAGSDWAYWKNHPEGVGPGTVAVANTNPKPYPFGTKFVVQNPNGTSAYTGTALDTGAGWDASHHNVPSSQWIDIWLPGKQANQWGVQWRNVQICVP